MIKLLASAAVAALLAFAPPAAQAQEEQPLSPKQQEAVKKLVRDYIMANPEIIAEAIEALREKQRLAAEEEAAKALVDRAKEVFQDPSAPVAGNPQGDVTLVEFFDYRCTYCKSVADAVFDAVRADGKVKLVFKEFPILGPESVVAARAALASVKQNKYEVYHRALMKMRGKVDEQSILKTAAEVGIDVEKLKKDMGDADIDAALKRNIELARALDIGGTPAFVIGDRIIPGAVDQPTLKRLIEETRKPTERTDRK
jgi:protein-disulfide isomerase